MTEFKFWGKLSLYLKFGFLIMQNKRKAHSKVVSGTQGVNYSGYSESVCLKWSMVKETLE